MSGCPLASFGGVYGGMFAGACAYTANGTKTAATKATNANRFPGVLPIVTSVFFVALVLVSLWLARRKS